MHPVSNNYFFPPDIRIYPKKEMEGIPLPNEWRSRFQEIIEGTEYKIKEGENESPFHLPTFVQGLQIRLGGLFKSASLTGGAARYLIEEGNENLSDIDVAIELLGNRIDKEMIKHIIIQYLEEFHFFARGGRLKALGAHYQNAAETSGMVLFTLPCSPCDIDFTIVWNPVSSCRSSFDSTWVQFDPFMEYSPTIKNVDGYKYTECRDLWKKGQYKIDFDRIQHLRDPLNCYVFPMFYGLIPIDAKRTEEKIIAQFKTRHAEYLRLVTDKETGELRTVFMDKLLKYIERHCKADRDTALLFLSNYFTILESASDVPDRDFFLKDLNSLFSKYLRVNTENIQQCRTILFWTVAENLQESRLENLNGLHSTRFRSGNFHSRPPGTPRRGALLHLPPMEDTIQFLLNEDPANRNIQQMIGEKLASLPPSYQTEYIKLIHLLCRNSFDSEEFAEAYLNFKSSLSEEEKGVLERLFRLYVPETDLADFLHRFRMVLLSLPFQPDRLELLLQSEMSHTHTSEWNASWDQFVHSLSDSDFFPCLQAIATAQFFPGPRILQWLQASKAALQQPHKTWLLLSEGIGIKDKYTQSLVSIKEQAAAYLLYCARLGFEDLDSARQSQIEASIARNLQEERHSQIGKSDDKDRLGKVATSPNLQNLTARSIKKDEEQTKAFVSNLLSEKPSDELKEFISQFIAVRKGLTVASNPTLERVEQSLANDPPVLSEVHLAWVQDCEGTTWEKIVAQNLLACSKNPHFNRAFLHLATRYFERGDLIQVLELACQVLTKDSVSQKWKDLSLQALRAIQKPIHWSLKDLMKKAIQLQLIPSSEFWERIDPRIKLLQKFELAQICLDDPHFPDGLLQEFFQTLPSRISLKEGGPQKVLELARKKLPQNPTSQLWKELALQTLSSGEGIDLAHFPFFYDYLTEEERGGDLALSLILKYSTTYYRDKSKANFISKLFRDRSASIAHLPSLSPSLEVMLKSNHSSLIESAIDIIEEVALDDLTEKNTKVKLMRLLFSSLCNQRGCSETEKWVEKAISIFTDNHELFHFSESIKVISDVITLIGRQKNKDPQTIENLMIILLYRDEKDQPIDPDLIYRMIDLLKSADPSGFTKDLFLELLENPDRKVVEKAWIQLNDCLFCSENALQTFLLKELLSRFMKSLENSVFSNTAAISTLSTLIDRIHQFYYFSPLYHARLDLEHLKSSQNGPNLTARGIESTREEEIREYHELFMDIYRHPSMKKSCRGGGKKFLLSAVKTHFLLLDFCIDPTSMTADLNTLLASP